MLNRIIDLTLAYRWLVFFGVLAFSWAGLTLCDSGGGVSRPYQ